MTESNITVGGICPIKECGKGQQQPRQEEPGCAHEHTFLKKRVQYRRKSTSIVSKTTETVQDDIVTTTTTTTTTTTRTTKTNYVYYRKLCKFHELPTWQRDNDKILSGYVKETNSFRHCLLSLFYFHNESVNVYSHLIPSVIYMALGIFLLDKLCIKVFPSTTLYDYIFINIFLLGCGTCLLFSGCFHCLKQHSERQSILWSKIDYIGIVLLISCSMISVIYYGYFDHPDIMLSFITMVVVLGIICSLVVTNDIFNQQHWKPVRATFFVSFALSGLVPMIFGIVKFGYLEVLNRICLKFIWLETLFYLLGAIVYGCKLPESLLMPGTVDLLGNSHQMFHCMVVLGSICHCKAVFESYNLLHRRYTSM